MFSDNLMSVDNPTQTIINEILQLDAEVESIIRIGMPETWLQINLPLGSTRALLAIASGNAATPRQVAAQLGVGRTTVTGLLDKLEGAGLLTREIDPNDRRSFILRLTTAGEELVRQIDETRREKLSQAMAQLDSRALEALQYGLQALAGAMKQIQSQQKLSSIL